MVERLFGKQQKNLGQWTWGWRESPFGKLLGWHSQQNLKEADYMLEGGLGDRDGGVKIVLLKNG